MTHFWVSSKLNMVFKAVQEGFRNVCLCLVWDVAVRFRVRKHHRRICCEKKNQSSSVEFQQWISKRSTPAPLLKKMKRSNKTRTHPQGHLIVLCSLLGMSNKIKKQPNSLSRATTSRCGSRHSFSQRDKIHSTSLLPLFLSCWIPECSTFAQVLGLWPPLCERFHRWQGDAMASSSPAGRSCYDVTLAPLCLEPPPLKSSSLWSYKVVPNVVSRHSAIPETVDSMCRSACRATWRFKDFRRNTWKDKSVRVLWRAGLEWAESKLWLYRL